MTNWSNTSVKALAVQNSLRFVQAALKDDPACSDWLGGADASISAILGANPLGRNFIGAADLDQKGVNAFQGNSGTDLGDGIASITVANNGAFFNSDVGVGDGVQGITGGTDAAKAFILLHELAHFLGAARFQSPDGGTDNKQAQIDNNELVQEKCSNTIGKFK